MRPDCWYAQCLPASPLCLDKGVLKGISRYNFTRDLHVKRVRTLNAMHAGYNEYARMNNNSWLVWYVLRWCFVTRRGFALCA